MDAVVLPEAECEDVVQTLFTAHSSLTAVEHGNVGRLTRGAGQMGALVALATSPSPRMDAVQRESRNCVGFGKPSLGSTSSGGIIWLGRSCLLCPHGSRLQDMPPGRRKVLRVP